MTSLSELRFYATPGHACSYLPGQEATTVFVDPAAEVDTALYTTLSTVGFRRSGNHIYRPYCTHCRACVPVRLPVARFAPKRRHRRILKRNADLVVTEHAPAFTDEYYALYEQYINNRHADGDMYPPAPDQFRSFLVDGRAEARFIDFRLGDQLLAVAIVDHLDDGLSAIYTFFDTADDDRSPGAFAILWLIAYANDLGLPHLYLGYWIEHCQKMNYKLSYQPAQVFINDRWQEATEDGATGQEMPFLQPGV